MQTYIDTEGMTCQAFQLTAPTLLNTVEGEVCGDAGLWAVYIEANQGRPVLVSETTFAASFTQVD